MSAGGCNGSGLGQHDSQLSISLSFVPASVYLARVLKPLWIGIGVPGSVGSFLVWSSRRMRSSSSVYLCALALLDCVFLLLQQVPWHLQVEYNADVLNRPLVCQCFPAFSFWLQYLSPLLTLGFTVERYISICHPFSRDRLCTVRRAVLVTTCMTLSCLACACVQVKFYVFEEGMCYEDTRIFQPGTFERGFYNVWSKLTEVTFFLVVPLAILAFNALVLVQAKKVAAKQVGGQQAGGKSSAATVTLLTVSFYQIAAVLPVSILLFAGLSIIDVDLAGLTCGLSDEEVKQKMADGQLPQLSRYFAYQAANSVVGTLAVSHYAMKFVIYFTTGRLFRAECLGRLGRCLPCLKGYAPPKELALPARRTPDQRRRMRRVASGEEAPNPTTVGANGCGDDQQQEKILLIQSG